MIKAFKTFMRKSRRCADGAVLFSTLLIAKQIVLYSSVSGMSLSQVNLAGPSMCDPLLTSGDQLLIWCRKGNQFLH